MVWRYKMALVATVTVIVLLFIYILVLSGKPNDSSPNDKQINMIKKRLVSEPENIEDLTDLALLYRDKSQYYDELYIELLKKGEKIEPSANPVFSVLLANYYYFKNQCTPATRAARKVVFTNEIYPDLHLLISNCHKRRGELSEAKQEIQKAINILETSDVESIVFPDKAAKEGFIETLKYEMAELEKFEDKEEILREITSSLFLCSD